MANGREICDSGEKSNGDEARVRRDVGKSLEFTLESPETIEPGTISSDGISTGTIDHSSVEPIKRKGRPKGSKNKGTGTGKTSSQDKENLTTLLLSLHMMAAEIIKTPELEIEKQEAERLADAVQRVNEVYDFVINERAAAWGNFAIVMCGIYAPRFIAIKNNKKRAPLQVIGNA